MKVFNTSFSNRGIEIETDNGKYVVEGRQMARERGHIYKETKNGRLKFASGNDKFDIIRELCKKP